MHCKRSHKLNQTYTTFFLHRMCYFTSASTNRKSDFMRELNGSYKLACLQCSFSDRELSELIQFKKRSTRPLPIKNAVSHVGLQADGTWVLGSCAYFSSDGEAIEMEGSRHAWIGDMFEGAGIAAATQQCDIQLPLSTKPLQHLLQVLKSVMKHNFYPCVFTMAGTIMALHYQTFIEKLRSCPITLAYGQSGTGKTTALHCGLGLLGVDNLRFFRDLSPAKVSQLCSVTSIPLGVDDPDSRNSFSKIIMDLFNGAKRGTLSRGEVKPTSTVVISSNITPIDQQRLAITCTFFHRHLCLPLT